LHEVALKESARVQKVKAVLQATVQRSAIETACDAQQPIKAVGSDLKALDLNGEKRPMSLGFCLKWAVLGRGIS
jgi:hypothetical protein